MDKQVIEAKMECIAELEEKIERVSALIEKELETVKLLTTKVIWRKGVKNLSSELKDVEKHIKNLRDFENIAQAYSTVQRGLRIELENTLYVENEVFFDSLNETEQDFAMELFKKGYNRFEIEKELKDENFLK